MNFQGHLQVDKIINMKVQGNTVCLHNIQLA